VKRQRQRTKRERATEDDREAHGRFVGIIGTALARGLSGPRHEDGRFFRAPLTPHERAALALDRAFPGRDAEALADASIVVVLCGQRSSPPQAPEDVVESLAVLRQTAVGEHFLAMLSEHWRRQLRAVIAADLTRDDR